MSAAEQPSPAAPVKMTKLKALATLFGAMGMSAAFIAICSLVGNHDFYAGFLFLLCWTVMEHARMERLPHTVVGGAFGLLLGFLLQYLLAAAIPMGGLLFTAIVMVVLYCQFLGWLPHFANLTAFTFLLIATIPYIQAQAKFIDLAISLAIGVAFFTPIIWFALHYLPKHKASS